MKKFFALALTLALIGMVSAQSDYADNSLGGNTASASETINISIPHRVALHLTDTGFDLNLNNLETLPAGVRCFLVPKDAMPANGFTNYGDFAGAISAHQVSTYPAVVFDGDGNVATEGGEYLKGGLACSNTKIVQKYSNYLAGWALTADVNIPALSGINFGIMDTVENNPWYVADGDTGICLLGVGPWCFWYEGLYSYYLADSLHSMTLDDSTLANQRLGKTNGWLDDYITEWFFFDGSEIAGNHTITVQFTLTGGL